MGESVVSRYNSATFDGKGQEGRLKYSIFFLEAVNTTPHVPAKREQVEGGGADERIKIKTLVAQKTPNFGSKQRKREEKKDKQRRRERRGKERKREESRYIPTHSELDKIPSVACSTETLA
jgi:hypothetical protein